MTSKDVSAKFAELNKDIEKILISEEQLHQKISLLGKQITNEYQGKNPLFIGVLKGVLFFMADLLREITIPHEMDFIAVSSYSPESRDQGVVRMVKDLEIPIKNRHVVFVEDVIDTGLTLNYILDTLKIREPASLEVCVLFNKPAHRLINIPLKYKGFDLPDSFVVGYGLDYREKYRNLPYVGLLRPQVFQK